MLPHRTLLAALSLLALGLGARAETQAPPDARPAAGVEAITPPQPVPSSLIAGHFRLAAPDGAAVDSDDLSGKPYALFFGFTHCPDICPTTLSEVSLALARLPAGTPDLKVYFVSVDPERDTREVLARYMASFDPRIVALSGDRPAVDEAIRSFGVVARRTDFPNGAYAYGHTAAIYLVDGDGVIVDRVGAGKGPDALAERLTAFLAPPLAAPAAPTP
ncbi:SCO family protein [Methylobacterium oxalidis]|uniref:SCO family protein n=1 Tax=Methylobacterium oxalidis TaxID=944322 RepID=UPI003314BC5C